MNVVYDRFLFTFNFDRLDEHSKDSNLTFGSIDEKTSYIECIIDKLPYNLIMLDYTNFNPDDMYHTFEKMANGHVRFILGHNN